MEIFRSAQNDSYANRFVVKANALEISTQCLVEPPHLLKLLNHSMLCVIAD
jgi:hypothetical protein